MGRRTGPTPETVALVMARQEGRCVCCGHMLTGQRGWDWGLHHRRGRDGRPDSHQPQNLIAVHGADNVTSCHGFVHSHRRAAEDFGWWLSRTAGVDPLLVPVHVVGAVPHRVYLTADGGVADVPPDVAA